MRRWWDRAAAGVGTDARRRWVLLPGTLCTPDVFDPMLSALGVAPAQRAGVALDRPDVDDYRAELRATLRTGDIVCGFSLGAIVAAHCVADLSGAATLVLLGVNPLADAPEKRDGRLSLRDTVNAGQGADALRRDAPLLCARPDPAVVDRIVNMAAQAAPLIDAQTRLALGRPGALGALARADMPVLAVTGAQDCQAPPALAEQVAAAAPHAALRIVPDLGHFALLEGPVATAQAVRVGLALLGVALP